MRTTLWLVCSLLLANLALADGELEIGGVTLHPGPQDIVQVTQNAWAWRSGPQTMPCVNVTLQSGRFRYVIRHDQLHDHGQLGLTGPTSCNWYQAGMVQLYLNDQRLDLTPEHGESIELTSGGTGCARLSWENEVAKTTWRFYLKTGEDRLYLVLDITPKTELKSLRLRLMNYVAGFNHSPQHRLWTSVRELTENGTQQLDPATEHALFLADDSLDVATALNAAGPSAMVVDPTGLQSFAPRLGGYGVPIDLSYDPGTRRLAFCFWEYPARTNAEALERFKGAWQTALATLGTLGGEQ